jgi:predicted metal-dependent hydrolase
VKNSIRTTNKPLHIGNYEIAVGNEIISYTLKRSLRARMVWLQIHSEKGLNVTVPRNYNVDDVPAYIISKSSWILRHLKRIRSEVPSSKVPQLPLCYLGNPLKIFEEASKPNYILPDGSGVDHNSALIWLRQQSQDIIVSKVSLYSQRIGVRFARVSIRDQKTRWGSCSHLGNLNFNWRLIMAPEPVLDYVIIHELCHLKRMSHSKAFWSIVTKYCSDWPEKRRWLNKHSRELHYFHSSSV